MANWFCTPPALPHGGGAQAAVVSPTAGINTSSAGTSSQLPKAVADKRVSKEPLTEVLGLAPRPAILQHSTGWRDLHGSSTGLGVSPGKASL